MQNIKTLINLRKLFTISFFALVLLSCNNSSPVPSVAANADSASNKEKIVVKTPAATPKNLLINNVQIFNGKDQQTKMGNVLVIGKIISKISATSIDVSDSLTVEVIDGRGKFLMP